MMPKLIFTLLFLLNLSCYASNHNRSNNFALKADTNFSIKKVKKQAPPTLTKLQRLKKLWKPSYDFCTFTNQYTIKQRLKKYPFSKVAKILAVSYYGGAQPNPEIHLDGRQEDTLLHKDDRSSKGLVVLKDSLDRSTLYDIKELDQNQINRLTNIIYNTDYKKKIGINAEDRASCYEPRNAFIFFDEQGKVFDYLEICFACRRYSSISDKLTIGVECTQKYEILRKYFISTGVKYGTKKNLVGYN